MKRLLSLVSLLVASASCVEVPPSGVGACPVPLDDDGNLDVASFAPVSGVLEQRCGSLDCHGSLGRPMRVYGYSGLRFVPTYSFDDAGQIKLAAEATAYVDPTVAVANDFYPGGGSAKTTEAEMDQTLRSICGMQPEIMRQVALEGAEPEKLLLLSKPLMLERHKGWKVFERGSLDHRCISTWLHSQLPGKKLDATACEKALESP
ncbi:MAG: hypothetical protein FJ096_19830 [Deltaproteobacteria bacterium]|nr:hypothetical protein [Deltaproteobacteria bacterium]